MKYVTDRTTMEKDWECPRARYWYREHAGTGITPVKEAGYYKAGRLIHADLAALLEGQSLDAVIAAHSWPDDQIEREQLAWHVGILTAFSLVILPQWLTRYDVVMVEKELILDRDPLWIACTEDVTLRNKETGRLAVKDFKSTKTASHNWTHHWPYAVQMQINMAAVGEELGEEVEFAHIIGLQKGDVRSGLLRHPYVYTNDRDGKPQVAYHKDATLRGTWTYDDDPFKSIIEVITGLGEATALSMFPVSAPIYPNKRILDRLIKQREYREHDIVGARRMVEEGLITSEEVLDRLFPQHFSNCRPSFGDECPFLACCHNAVVEADPIESGDYKVRVPHHDVELVMREKEETQ